MTKQAFNLAWASLLNAFSGQAERMTGESQDVYWEILRNIPDDLWAKGVKECLANCKFFPSIHELGVACCGEQRVISDPFAHLTPWINPPTKKITWQENLEKFLEKNKLNRLVLEEKGKQEKRLVEPPEVRAARK